MRDDSQSQEFYELASSIRDTTRSVLEDHELRQNKRHRDRKAERCLEVNYKTLFLRTLLVQSIHPP